MVLAFFYAYCLKYHKIRSETEREIGKNGAMVKNLPRTGKLFDKIGKKENYQELAHSQTKLEN